VLIIFVILIDIISFYETRVLLSLFDKVESGVQALFLAFAEIFLMINIFVITFSLGLAIFSGISESRDTAGYFALNFDQTPLDENQVSVGTGNSNFDTSTTKYFTAGFSKGRLDIWPTTEGKNDFMEIQPAVYSNQNVTISDVLRAINQLDSTNGSLFGAREASGSSPPITDELGFDRDFQAIGNYELRTSPIFRTIWLRYSAAYNVATAVQTDFPASASLLPGWKSNTDLAGC
jgi:hypothetical protein